MESKLQMVLVACLVVCAIVICCVRCGSHSWANGSMSMGMSRWLHGRNYCLVISMSPSLWVIGPPLPGKICNR
ncbi:MAG: hypothetical protein BYD32DRAFT_431667 [Podila humilis]|nr:MAG: hypothetical protein BYD32DRAFT_431667 [Podila humilis]